MTTGNMPWQDAIVRVLEDAGEPLHYQEITNRIKQQRLRELSGATPSATVRHYLGRMVKKGEAAYNHRIKRVAPGTYRFLDNSLENDEVADIVLVATDDDKDALVPAFGLYWEKDYVYWKSKEILGRQGRDFDQVNFADQWGVYALHRDNAVVYVGQTTDSLYRRLNDHNNNKNLRWNKFSWFGFRGVVTDEDGNPKLDEISSEFPLSDVITILESVLIESLEPPLNGQRGNRMGEIYEQVVHPKIQQSQRYEILATLGSELQGLVEQR